MRKSGNGAREGPSGGAGGIQVLRLCHRSLLFHREGSKSTGRKRGSPSVDLRVSLGHKSGRHHLEEGRDRARHRSPRPLQRLDLGGPCVAPEQRERWRWRRRRRLRWTPTCTVNPRPTWRPLQSYSTYQVSATARHVCHAQLKHVLPAGQRAYFRERRIQKHR